MATPEPSARPSSYSPDKQGPVCEALHAQARELAAAALQAQPSCRGQSAQPLGVLPGRCMQQACQSCCAVQAATTLFVCSAMHARTSSQSCLTESTLSTLRAPAPARVAAHQPVASRRRRASRWPPHANCSAAIFASQPCREGWAWGSGSCRQGRCWSAVRLTAGQSSTTSQVQEEGSAGAGTPGQHTRPQP